MQTVISSYTLHNVDFTKIREVNTWDIIQEQEKKKTLLYGCQ